MKLYFYLAWIMAIFSAPTLAADGQSRSSRKWGINIDLSAYADKLKSGFVTVKAKLAPQIRKLKRQATELAAKTPELGQKLLDTHKAVSRKVTQAAQKVGQIWTAKAHPKVQKAVKNAWDSSLCFSLLGAVELRSLVSLVRRVSKFKRRGDLLGLLLLLVEQSPSDTLEAFSEEVLPMLQACGQSLTSFGRHGECLEICRRFGSPAFMGNLVGFADLVGLLTPGRSKIKSYIHKANKAYRFYLRRSRRLKRVLEKHWKSVADSQKLAQFKNHAKSSAVQAGLLVRDVSAKVARKLRETDFSPVQAKLEGVAKGVSGVLGKIRSKMAL